MKGVDKMKMSKKIQILLIIFLIFFSFSSCLGKDIIQEDILNYTNSELPKIAEIEKAVIESYENITGTNYKDDVTTYNVLEETVIPNSLNLIEKAEAITPKTAEVKAIHELYLDSINEQNNAFTIMLSALQNQDYQALAKANEKLDSSRKKQRDFNSNLNTLASKHNVEFK
jgi:hypothetical protein